MDQEPGTSEEIATFCSRTFGVTFLLMQKEKVVGNEKHPFFNWAKEQNGFGSGVKWNFHKYLFDRKGNALTFFMPTTPPDAPKVIKAIEQALTS
jgi:glutathione peroxidase